MANNENEPTNTQWSGNFETLRRQNLFQNPPKDHTAYPALQDAVRPHIESFNAIIEPGGLLDLAVKDIGTKVWSDESRDTHSLTNNLLRVRLKQVFIERPQLPAANKFSTRNREVLPSECRERHVSYKAKMKVRMEVRVNEGAWIEFTRELGQVPVMIKSNRCHLEKCSPAGLVRNKEESEELGGYFIVNGNERLIRMLIVGRRNFPLAVIRPSFKNRGPTYSHFGILIRCVRPDQSSQSNGIHYLNDGNIIFRFSWRKSEYQIPVMMILKALIDTNDREIFESIVGPNHSKAVENTFLTDRVEMLLRTYKTYKLYDKRLTREFLGEKFGVKLRSPENLNDEQLGAEVLRKIVLVHLGSEDSEAQDTDKFRLIILMIRKLYALVAGDCAVDNPDALSSQEILLGGSLYSTIIKERLDDWLGQVRDISVDYLRRNNRRFNSPEFMNDFVPKILQRSTENIGSALEYFLSTGNLVSSSGLDLQDTTGYTIVAEKINFFRFISHFRMVHRGSFFAQLRTTSVRKLLPESWGFTCPVHTPDGGPCGLLNHLAHKCRLVTRPLDVSSLPGQVAQLGVITRSSASLEECVVIQLDGRILGFCSPSRAKEIADTLRYWKVSGQNGIPLTLEIGYVPNTTGGQYPGIYMFSQQSRMIRQVKYLPLGKEDYVGPMEQPHMSIACTEPEIVADRDTHVEFTPTNILSIIANMTPFSDFNQSPRNMYQCQMGKQAMGTPGTSIRYRADNKSYRLQTGQTPVVRSPLHNAYGLDNFPNGMNSVVAVISYTGYDMDDAMIINKSSHERGFGHGTVYKTKIIDLSDGGGRSRTSKKVDCLFGFAPGAARRREWSDLDADGLPFIGTQIREGSVLCVHHTVSQDASGQYVNRDKTTVPHKYSDSETAYVEEVRLIGADTGDTPLSKVTIKLRIPRSPVIGDKFSSRHGQKGVCSQKWPTPDMPFSESGIVPDTIINPHAFPSRMTIGMFMESLAGKSGSLHGFSQDCTPWSFDEKHRAHEYFGEQLRIAGYNYYGNEPMYSGITGEEFEADIYIGVVYYQRLRHMVNDKFQVRTTGPVTRTMGQPVKGRAKGGGVRVGEMERDSLLAHGTVHMLQDRLLNCSDYSLTWICKDCGGLLGCTPTVSEVGSRSRGLPSNMRCRRCATKASFGELKSKVWEDANGQKYTGGDHCTVVCLPGSLKYLDAELHAMGIRMNFVVGPAETPA
ncbi:MAG: DNA-directed RNA polymerase I subunit RPA2 [Vezdaea aestivalis]|nr:MAG: DNA-directed RNA polymerase I subunit RPA2 [Vezdaea aestivalis]